MFTAGGADGKACAPHCQGAGTASGWRQQVALTVIGEEGKPNQRLQSVVFSQSDFPKRRMWFEQHAPPGVAIFLAFAIAAHASKTAEAKLFSVDQRLVGPLPIGMQPDRPISVDFLFTRQAGVENEKVSAGFARTSRAAEIRLAVEKG